MNKQVSATLFAVLAAVLYAVNIPFSKLLLNFVHPVLMASFLYFGAGIGISAYSAIFRKTDKAGLTKRELPYTLAMIALDIVAPILLMIGLKTANPANAALLNNFEIVATALVALFVFRELISGKLWFAILLITVSSALLSFENGETFRFSWGSLLVLAACICWGFENNCTRVLSSKSVYQIVILKGVFSGAGSLLVALLLGDVFPEWTLVLLALLLGFVSYGLSIYFYIKSQSIIGAAKTSAFYSLAPFIGALVSFVMFREPLSENYPIALAIMVCGTGLIIFDTLAIGHKHAHTHSISALGTSVFVSHMHFHFHSIGNEANHSHRHGKRANLSTHS